MNTSIIYVEEFASLVMLDGSMVTDSWVGSSQLIGLGAAVMVMWEGSLIMKGGEITENVSPGWVNGSSGVLVGEEGIVEIQGGGIYDNLREQGGQLFYWPDIGISNGAVNNVSSVTFTGSGSSGIVNVVSTATARNTVRIGSGWTGEIEEFWLFGNTPTATLVSWWTNQPLMTAAPGHTLTTADVNRVTFGLTELIADVGGGLGFVDATDHLRIENTGANIGRLVPAGSGPSPSRPSAAPAVVGTARGRQILNQRAPAGELLIAPNADIPMRIEGIRPIR